MRILTSILFVLVFAVLVWAGQTDRKHASPAAGSLSGTTWTLAELYSRPVLPDSPVTLSFNEGGRITGTDGCSRYSGSYKANGSNLSFGKRLAGTMMARIYSDLHQNILDAFNEHGVQIMSPHYESDPSGLKVVSKEDWYAAPAKPPGMSEGGK